jgi:hypothetical protein
MSRVFFFLLLPVPSCSFLLETDGNSAGLPLEN